MDRRTFLGTSAAVAGAVTAPCFSQSRTNLADLPLIQLGLVTYNWGKNWDLPTVIATCEKTRFDGVELRSTHKHGVEITLNKKQRREVASRFRDTKVQLAGLGTACEYHAADKKVLQKNIDESKAFVELCHDIGGGGIKVRPNGLPKGVSEEKTLAQIGKALNEVGEYGAGFGVQIRLEVHGRGTAEIPRIKKIMDVADNPNVYVCWNCNPQDLQGAGLKDNFGMLAKRMGTIHIHDLRSDAYPWKDLFALFKKHRFQGWTLLEDGKIPKDIVAAMHANRKIWDKLATA